MCLPPDDKVPDKQRDVFASQAERRYLDGEHGESIVQVCTKFFLGHCLVQIAIGGRNHTDINRDRFPGARPLELPFLENSQQLRLKVGLEITDFMMQSIDVPETDETVQQLKQSLSTRADIDILGQENYRMKRTFDTLEKAAESEGGSGQLMGAGMGLGLGFGVGHMMPGMMGTSRPMSLRSSTNLR